MLTPIQLVEFERAKGVPNGSKWLLVDENALAVGIARLALGQWKLLEGLLQNDSAEGTAAPTAPAVSAINMLTVPAGADPWHRDGWMFQCISWMVAAQSSLGPTRPPQMSHADKGFDGVQLVLSSDGRRLKRVLIFEDKATNNPRATIRKDVWPGLRTLESGVRDNALVSEVSFLLERSPSVDRVDAANKVFRLSRRTYRVAITVTDIHDSTQGLARLFKGYKSVVPGGRARRHGHVMRVDDLRNWMDSIAALAIAEVRRLGDV